MKKIDKFIIPDKTRNSYYIANPQQFDKLFDIVSNNLRTYTIILRSKSYFRTLIWVYVQTQILDDIDASLKTRIYWIFNDIRDYVKCVNPNCTNKLKEVQNIADGYNGGYCSRYCSANDPCKQQRIKSQFEQQYGKGITCPQKLPAVRQRISQALNSMTADQRLHTNDLLRQTWKNKSPEQIDKIVQQRKKTSLDRYGVEVPSQSTDARLHMHDIMSSEDIQQRIMSTKRKNGTFNTSKPEDESYELLCEKFGKDDVIRQYKSEKYPFNCDFYVKSIDTYIECNFNWTHGGHPFDPNSEEDQAQLQAWKDKDTKFYQVAIDVWTRRDPNKMKTALDNNLRFKVFWTIDDVNDWIMHLNIQ